MLLFSYSRDRLRTVAKDAPAAGETVLCEHTNSRV